MCILHVTYTYIYEEYYTDICAGTKYYTDLCVQISDGICVRTEYYIVLCVTILRRNMCKKLNITEYFIKTLFNMPVSGI